MRPQTAHYWLRKNVAENLRSEDFWQVNSILGGYDTFEKKAYLTLIDYLASNIPCQASSFTIGNKDL